MSTTAFSGNFFENVNFRGQMDGMLNGTDPSLAATSVRAALDSVNPGSLSTSEKNVILTATNLLSADGQISNADATILVGLIDGFAKTGRLVDTLTGGNNGQLIDVFNRSNSFLPFQPADLARFPGSALFGGLLGAIVNNVVQSFKDGLFMGMANALTNSAGDGIFGLGARHKQEVLQALENVNLSQLSPADRAKVLSMIGFAASDGYISRAETNAITDFLARFTYTKPAPAAPTGDWKVERVGDNRAHIDLGRYTLDLNDHNSEMILTNKETGEKTRIWGDPHFDYNGQRVGDFYGTLTLSLEDGTKITIDTTPWEAGGNGTTLSSRLTITQGDRAIVVEGLDQNTKNDLQITEYPSGFGGYVDALRNDGTVIYENPEGDGWLRLHNGGWLDIDREFLRQV